MTGLLPPNVLSYEGQVAIPFINRTADPTTSNFQFNVPTIWTNTASKRAFILLAKPMNVADWVPFGGGSGTVFTFVEDSGSAAPMAGILHVVGGTGISTVGSGNTITINASAITSPYTNVTHAMSPYTVLITDEYISVDCSGGAVVLDFPNSPVNKQQWIVKDRTGSAATNNISITTPGGTVTIDGQTTYKIISNFGSVNLLANATPTYEVF